MKKIGAIALLVALALTGCGNGGNGASSASSTSGADVQVGKDSYGYSTETVFVDENGRTTSRISEIKSSATGKVPPKAPDIGGKSQSLPSIGMR